MGWNRDQYDRKKTFSKFNKHRPHSHCCGSWVKRTPSAAKDIAASGNVADMTGFEQAELLQKMADYVREKEGL